MYQNMTAHDRSEAYCEVSARIPNEQRYNFVVDVNLQFKERCSAKERWNFLKYNTDVTCGKIFISLEVK